MVPEANIVKRENGLVPDGEGWYVLNARESTWLHTDDFGVACTFEGDVRFAEFGITSACSSLARVSCSGDDGGPSRSLSPLAGGA